METLIHIITLDKDFRQHTLYSELTLTNDMENLNDFFLSEF